MTASTPARRPGPTPASALDEAAVLAALRDVVDPEIPTTSIVDLGMVGAISIDDERVRVELLPTFIGCPAFEMIQASVVDGLGGFGRKVEAVRSTRIAWTSDRISAGGRESLRRSGFAPPSAPEDVRCPYCASALVAMDSAFGPTQCRSLFYCRGCRQPFEAFKPI